LPEGPLVDAGWLGSHVHDAGVVVADARWHSDGSGRAKYEAGHIPGAVFVDVDTDLSGPKTASTGRHPLPSPAAFAAAMSRLGIGDDDLVVAYDDAGGANAARLWWMLDVTGHQTALLDGGQAAWPGPLETGASQPREHAAFTERPWPANAIADAAMVDRLRGDPDALILDARAGERFRGETEPIDPVAGRIPAAKSAPFAGNLDPATGRFLSPAALRERYESLGVVAGEVVAYCGSGVTSAHDVFAMRLAGFERPRLYVGSWSEWIRDPSRPIATGDD
jgi:thiosulfate/3-mercaptopyruvate sulfurtransferase